MRARVLQDCEKVATHQHLAPAESQEENTSIGDLIEHVADLGGGHFAMIVVIEITVNTAFVTTIGHIKLDTERHSQFERPRVHLLDEAHCALLDSGPAVIG